MVDEATQSVVGKVPLWLLALIVPLVALIAVVATGPTWSAPAAEVVSPAASSGGTSPGSAIFIKNFAFAPNVLRVAPGTKVEVMNDDSTTHTFTAVGHQFDTKDLGSGKRATITAPATPGVYKFMCKIHPNMTGTLVVTTP